MLQFAPRGSAATRSSVAVALRPDSDPPRVLEHAVGWAGRLNARVDLCTVLPGIRELSAASEFSVVRDVHLRPRRIGTRRWLRRLMSTVPAQSRGQITILEGDPATMLTAYCRAHSLLVLGPARRSGLRSLLWPNLSSRIAQRCPVPVLIATGHLSESKRRTAPGQGDDARERGLSPAGVGRALAECARRMDADVVAVPASSRTGMLRWFFGSAVDGLIEDGSRSVLLVPGPTAERPGALDDPRPTLRRFGKIKPSRSFIAIDFVKPGP